MSTQKVEALLARLYCDADFLAQFLKSPRDVLEREELTPAERMAMLAVDASELMLTARSYAFKRDGRKKPA